MERAILGGKVRQVTCAAYELAAHLTGRYPPWWKPVEGPITAWASGVDAKTVRESLQATLLGEPTGKALA
jgi:hypothetical protein